MNSYTDVNDYIFELSIVRFMQSDSIRKYQEFLRKVILHDQTHLVNALIERDEYISPFNDIQNKEEYEVELSDGKWIGTQPLLHVTVCEMQKELERLTQTMNDVVNIEKTKQMLQRKTILEADLKKLDSAKWKEGSI